MGGSAGSSGAGGEPFPTAGWELSASSVGLARLGLSCDSLPEYTGPKKPSAGSTISEQKITLEELDLSEGNITLDRVCVRPVDIGNRSSLIFGYNPDLGEGQKGPVTIKDSDIDGSSVSNPLIFATCAFRGAANLYRNHIWGMGSGICFFGSSSMTSAEVEQNYVHDLRAGMFGNPPQPSHNESATIRSFGGTSLLWKNNRLESFSGSDSGALFIQAYAGEIRNVVIEGNFMDTYGYDLPLETHGQNGYSNMKAIDNRFGLSGYGVGYVTGGPGWDVWADNYIYEKNAADGKGKEASCPGGTCGSVP
ncbi:MAG: hypothetical protein BWY17_05171 [Deltaproteobacteria bacterium ADurb.Bin207]|nr:MAG: hypothetical protein BWY17_05171 [Deltaproteobacteria bacterium ADurb.Bin207]